MLCLLKTYQREHRITKQYRSEKLYREILHSTPTFSPHDRPWSELRTLGLAMRDAEAKLLKWIPWRRALACGSSWQATAHWNLNAPKPAWRTRGPLCLLKYEAANTVAAVVWLQLSLGDANFSRPLPVITVMGSRNDGGQVDRRATLAPAWSYPRSGCFVMQFQSTVAFWWFCLKRKNKSHNNKSCT